ncbi:MAG: competence/damage-inducible protein A [Ignavibacteriales bacterium]|nr:competence/damage-inducible protein A [Ignavibacteriales bacterium]
MNAEIISIGDELLIGQVINTNQAFIAEKLNSVGIPVFRMTTVGDDKQQILTLLKRSWNEAEVVTVTGGLGPTHDDVTRSAICDFFETDLVRNDEALQNIERIFSARGLAVSKINEDQALVPRGCSVIQNRHGTAPGYFFNRDGKYMIVMPGVPYEMTAMMESFVVPHFTKHITGLIIRHKTLKTTGIPESHLAEKIGDASAFVLPGSGATLAYLPSPLGVRLRISVRSASMEEAGRRIQEIESKIRELAGKYVYGEDQEELEEALGRLLTQRRLTIAVAESCTGGLIADRLTNVPGSSAYFERGVISYSNASKKDELGVSENDLKAHGAVSREVAERMAEGIRKKSGADLGLSTTGIAGPSGGTPEKPVGLIWIGYSDEEHTIAMKFHFGTDRRRFKERASQAALELVRRKLLKIG